MRVSRLNKHTVSTLTMLHKDGVESCVENLSTSSHLLSKYGVNAKCTSQFEQKFAVPSCDQCFNEIRS